MYLKVIIWVCPQHRSVINIKSLININKIFLKKNFKPYDIIIVVNYQIMRLVICIYATYLHTYYK